MFFLSWRFSKALNWTTDYVRFQGGRSSLLAELVRLVVKSQKALLRWKIAICCTKVSILSERFPIVPTVFPHFPTFSHGFPMLFGSTQFSPCCQGPASSAWAGVSLACAPALRWPPSSRDFETDWFFWGFMGELRGFLGEISDGYLNGIESDFW
jgi:hypothetical protein